MKLYTNAIELGKCNNIQKEHIKKLKNQCCMVEAHMNR